MAKETQPKTYRVSSEVDGEIRRLAKIHGGVDKALRFQFGWPVESLVFAGAETVTVESVARRESVSTPKTGLRCNHCPQKRFTGSKYLSICVECTDGGHQGDPRDCQACADNSSTGAA